jgi:DNA-binding IclR family transcriptional regulator
MRKHLNRSALSDEERVRFVMRAPHGVNTAAPKPAETDLIAPIERGFAILEAFQAHDGWLSSAEVAGRTSIPKSTVTRLLQTLHIAGFLQHSSPLRKYRLSSAVLALGYAAIANSEVVTTARPLMQRLADENGVFVALGGRDDLHMVLLDLCHSASTPLTLGLRVGALVPITAPLGLAWLSGLPKAELSYLLDIILQSYDKNDRVTLRKRINDVVQQVADKRYFTVEDWGAGIALAAAPLQIPNKPLMAVVCASSKKQVTKAKLMDQIGPKLVELVSILEAETGHSQD